MARKTGLGPQGRRTIDEARSSDTASKGAFSEIPGRVESGQTEAPIDTIPGYVTAAERPKRKRKGGIGGIGRGLIDGGRSSNSGPTQAGSVLSAADRVAGMIPSTRVDSPPPQQRPNRTAPAPGGLLGSGLGAPSKGGRLLPNNEVYSGPANPNETIDIASPRPGEQWRGGPPTAERQAARKRDLEEMYQSGMAIRPPSSSSNNVSLRSGTTTGNEPSPANAGPGRSKPVNTSFGGGGGTPVISGTSVPGSGGGGSGGGGTPQSGVPWLDLAVQGTKAMFTPSPYAPMTWIERNVSPEGMSMIYGRGGGAQPLNGYETNRFHIESKKKNPSDNFRSSRKDPLVAEQEISQYPRESYQGGELPPFQQGGQTNASQRLHRDPLHDYTTGQGYAGTHGDVIGNTWGDAHTRATSGMSTPENPFNVQPIRAPKPE